MARKALITGAGAAGGIGLATARALLAGGVVEIPYLSRTRTDSASQALVQALQRWPLVLPSSVSGRPRQATATATAGAGIGAGSAPFGWRTAKDVKFASRGSALG